MSAAKEIEWVQASQVGDQDAFAQLVDRYRGTVTGVAYAVLGDFARSEDAGQDAFLEGWKRLSTLADPAKFAPWICTIARRRAVDLVRKQKPVASLAAVDVVPSKRPDVVEQVATAEEKAIVWQTLDGLPEKYRETMVLFYRGDQSIREVADALGEKESTIRQRLKRGRDLLRNEVSETVERTLRGTSPNAAFVLAVLGSLPGATKAAGAVAATASALLGMLGGIAGGLIGVGSAWWQAKFQSQRDVLVRSSLVFLGLMALFLIALFGLIQGHFGIATGTSTYGIALTVLIIGFQILCAAWGLWLLIGWKRATRESTESGDAVLPLAAATETKLRNAPDRCWTSTARFLGMPLVDVQIFTPVSTEQADRVTKSARGWIAVGNRAYGGLLAVGTSFAIAPIAVGQLSIGLISAGILGIGLCSISTVAIGVVSFGALAIGVTGYGGMAMGAFVGGGMAIGYCAFGGLAVAVGGQAYGQHANDAIGNAFFDQHWFYQWLGPVAEGEFPTWLIATFWIGLGAVLLAQYAFRRWILTPAGNQA